jgi:hypothetical protein
MDTKTTLLMKPAEVAEQLRVSRAKAYQLIAAKVIPSTGSRQPLTTPPMTPGAILDIARDLLGRGFSVIPIWPPGRGRDSKKPAIPWKRYQSARATEADLDRWFRESMNIGIVTGAISDLVVVDIDSPAAGRYVTEHLPYTPRQVKTGHGFHCYYKHAGIPVPNRVKLKTAAGKLQIDVRGDGGYVVGPGSLHASGTRYTFAGDWDRDDVPRFWPGWIAAPNTTHASHPTSTKATRGSHLTGDVFNRARQYLAAIPRPEIGAGSDDATFRAACRLVRGFGLPTYDAVTLLWEWAGQRHGWTHEWIVQKVNAAERYGREPVGGLR